MYEVDASNVDWGSEQKLAQTSIRLGIKIQTETFWPYTDRNLNLKNPRYSIKNENRAWLVSQNPHC